MTSIDVPDRVAADKVDIGRRAARVDLGVKAVGRSRQLTRIHDIAMAYLGLSRTKFYELLREGAFPAVRFGDRRLVRRVDLDAFIEANMEHGAPKPVPPRKSRTATKPKAGKARRP